MKNITFERQEHGEKYWYISTIGNTEYDREQETVKDNLRFNSGNYYATEEYTEYKSRVMRLQNNLEKFSAENIDCESVNSWRQFYIYGDDNFLCCNGSTYLNQKGMLLYTTLDVAEQCFSRFYDELKWHLTTEPPYLFEKDNSEEIKAIQKEKNKAIELRYETENKIIALNKRLKELDNE